MRLLVEIFQKIKALIRFFLPPDEWQVRVLIVLGILVGVGLYIFYISNASAYLSSNPKTCINCHVMEPQYATWQRSSHARVASCVDCHIPHDNILHKYEFKLKDGLRHATIFTLHQEPQVIQIKPDGQMVVLSNCIRCHESILEESSLHQTTYQDYLKGDSKLCWDCHRDVPHGTVHSLSATPYTQTPVVAGGAPEWLKDLLPVLEKYLH